VPPGVQGLDRYAYVNNNPVKYNDPSGHNPCDDWGACGYDSGSSAPISVVVKTSTPTTNPTYAVYGTEVANNNASPANPTYTPMTVYKPGPTSTPKPFDKSINSSNTSQVQHPYIYIDPNQVDYLNIVADVSGLIADGLTIAALKIPILAPAAKTAQQINTPIEGLGLAKSLVDITQGAPSGFVPFLSKSLQNTLIIGARSERLIPGVGFIGNFISLYFDLKPQIKWR